MANDFRYIFDPGDQNLTSASAYYVPIAGAQENTALVVGNEVKAQVKVYDTYTWKFLSSYCDQFNVASTVRSRVATANGAQTISIAGTGRVTDTTNADSLTTGNLINLSITDGSTSTNSFTTHSSTLER